MSADRPVGKHDMLTSFPDDPNHLNGLNPAALAAQVTCKLLEQGKDECGTHSGSEKDRMVVLCQIGIGRQSSVRTIKKDLEVTTLIQSFETGRKTCVRTSENDHVTVRPGDELGRVGNGERMTFGQFCRAVCSRFERTAVDEVEVVVLSCCPLERRGAINNYADHIIRQRFKTSARNLATVAPSHETESSKDTNTVDGDARCQ